MKNVKYRTIYGQNKKKKFRNLSISELFFEFGFSRFGGDKRDRTADLLNAMRKTPESNVSNVYF